MDRRLGFFFFSSRRRHTRLQGDWSSDVCSSDLVLLLTPDGRISRYFYGVEYPGRDMRLGLVEASAGKIGTPIDHVLLFCYQYDPSTATYSTAILRIIRLGGILTILCTVGGILIFRRRDARS